MAEDKVSKWNSLEIAKLVVGVATPLLLLVISLTINARLRDADLAASERQQQAEAAATERQREAELAANGQATVQGLARAMYARRARSELLSSAIRRHIAEPSAVSLEEVKDRKRLYDEVYAAWNGDLQANLLSVRQVLREKNYTAFEQYISDRLVGQVFKPLDGCLTKAYDATIRDNDPLLTLDECWCAPNITTNGDPNCSAGELIQTALDCSYALTNSLFLATFGTVVPADPSDPFEVGEITDYCPADGWRPSREAEGAQLDASSPPATYGSGGGWTPFGPPATYGSGGGWTPFGPPGIEGGPMR